ncbi:MAG TPA: glycosyltransferase family 4 protein [Burkholderiales bacterium]|nr:glycosyltransferase family 4 protein [Burkholderiales bacterium]
MRICFYNVTSSFIPGGLETYCWEMGRALAQRGHDVALVAGNRGGAWHDEVRLLQFPFRIEQDWPDFGHRFQRLMERLSFARHAAKHLLSSDYDAIVICKPYDFPVLWLAQRRGLKALTAYHAGGTDFYAGDRWFAGAVDRWIAVSAFTASQQRQRYRRDVAVVHNGVDVGRFKPQGRDPALRAQWNVPADARLAISVGRLVGLKGLRLIVSALPRLPQDVHYLVVGTGPAEPALRAQAASLGVASRVHFAGRIEHGQLSAALSQAEIFVQPSIGEEAFGISVIEAMACGLPVLAARIGGLPEVVTDAETGRLVAPGDSAAWTSALSEALADPGLLRRMGSAARRRAEAEFTWSASAAKLEKILQGTH